MSIQCVKGSTGVIPKYSSKATFKAGQNKNQPAKNDNAKNQNFTTSKSSKLPFVAGGLLIAGTVAVAGYLHKAKMLNSLKNNKAIDEATKKVVNTIQDIKYKNAGEVEKIIKENTTNGMIHLDKIDSAATLIASDKTRKAPFHEAAELLENAYNQAYQKSPNEPKKNMLDKILNRIKNENNSLAKIYKQMDELGSNLRISDLVKKISGTAKAKGETGMSCESFVQALKEIVSNTQI